MPSLLILIPLLGLIVMNLPFLRDVMRRLSFWFAAGLFAVQMLLAINHYPLFWGRELGAIDTFFKVNMTIDHFSFIMLLCIGIVSFVTLLVARHTVPDEDERFKFTNLLIVASIGMSGVVLVKDLFSMYVFLEITAISSFVLIAFEKDVLALEGSFKYMILSAVATIMMLSAIALLMLVSPDTSFASIRNAIAQPANARLAVLSIGIFICGLFIKGGVVPFHAWLPDAYSSAPSAVSVLLAGIVTKVAGIYTLIRVVVSVFGFTRSVQTLLLVLGAVSIVVGALAALRQTNLKRLLAYSSISQVGYIVLGFAAATPLGLAGAVFHIFNHSIFKSLLFVNAAAVESQVGSNDMERMGGLAQKMPVTGTTSVIAMLSAAGVPPMAGFWSKLIIIVALWQAGLRLYAVIAILAGVLSLAYLLTMQRKVFFGTLREGLENIREARRGLVAAAILLAIITIGIGIFFPIAFYAFAEPVKEMFIK